MAQWQKEIMKLFNDFCLPTETGKQIVKRVEREFPDATADEKYNAAWKGFKAELDKH